MFLVSKCRGDWYVGLCTFSLLAYRQPLRSGGFWKKTCFARRRNQNLALRSGSLFASTQKVQRPTSQFPLHFDIRNKWQIRLGKQFCSARRLLPADMLERWPQVCRVKITFTLPLTNRFVSTTTNSMKCLVNWTTTDWNWIVSLIFTIACWF